MTRKEALANLEEARAEVRAISEGLTVDDALKMMSGEVDTVELAAKQMAQHEAIAKVIAAEKELRASH